MADDIRNKVIYETIDESSDGQKIDNFLIKFLKNVPKSHIYKILRSGQVRVNKKRVRTAFKLSLNDSVRIPPVDFLRKKSVSINKINSDQFKIIEEKLLRVRGAKNQPRTCDVDIIDYKKRIINKKNVVTPHPRAHLRNFVLFPLREISPKWTHPVLNKKIDFLIKKLSFKLRNEITRIKEHVIID